MIWSGVNGRVQFAETLPYLALGIVLFYSAPGLVRTIQEMFGTEINIENYASVIFSTVAEISRVLSFAGIIFYGIKLMFGAFDQKVQLKKSFIAIFIGCIIVFSASTVVNVVLKSAKESGIKTDTTFDSINEK